MRLLRNSTATSPEKNTSDITSPVKKTQDNPGSGNSGRKTPRRSKQNKRQSDSTQPTIFEAFSGKRSREETVDADEKENVNSLRSTKVRKDSSERNTESNALGEINNEVTKNDVTEELLDDHNCVKNEPINMDDVSKLEKMEVDSSNDVENKNEIKETNCSDNGKTLKSTLGAKCNHCGQYSDDPNTQYFQGHPQDALEEYIALTSDKLTIETGEEGDITEIPQTKITEYSIYDESGHLCSLDGGFVESDVVLYMSGYLKAIVCDSPDVDVDSIPVKEVGPIIEWYTAGFDGGNINVMTVRTAYGEYNLMKPSAQYFGLMKNLYEKISLSKVVVEYLEDYHHLKPTYEDLLEVIRGKNIPEMDNIEMTEEMLHKHAEFVCDQVVNLEVDDNDNDEDYDDSPPLITTPCMRELIKLIGIRFGNKRSRGKIAYKKKTPTPSWTKATTTPLVRKTFETFFSNQLDEAGKDLVLRRKRCGICEPCQLPDCGQCKACKAMAKFGGSGRTKKACVKRICPNMAVEQAEDSDPENEEDYRQQSEKSMKNAEDNTLLLKLKATSKTVEWLGDPIKVENVKTYYSAVMIDDVKVAAEDFVMVETSRSNIPPYIVKISYIWKEMMPTDCGYFHGQIFSRSADTVLGEAADPSEVLMTNMCAIKIPLSSIIRKATVIFLKTPENWFDLGGKEVDQVVPEDDGKTYYCKKFYEDFTARFENIPEETQCVREERRYRFCPACVRSTLKQEINRPRLLDKLENSNETANRIEWAMMKWMNMDIKKGHGVFLKPGTFKFKKIANGNSYSAKSKLEKVDETIYTEYYRKSDSMRGSNEDTVEPFCIGHIASILSRGEGVLTNPSEIYLKVNVMYRPENTTRNFPNQEDLNLVYWSEIVKEVRFADLEGYCHLVYEKNIPADMSIAEWSASSPNRFYFKEAYDPETGKFSDVSPDATSVGGIGKAKEKGKGKGKANKNVLPTVNKTAELDAKIVPLRTLDVFAGCGGLSEGLHQTGIADCKWAIEFIEPAANAYQLNNKNCTVFTEDCNSLLKDVVSGATHSTKGSKLPMKGDVELLCGGPPCQGFSGMNRFNSREYSNFKNSLVASYLAYCDYYRPKYFILENVRNFVAYKHGMVLKLTLKCLLDMGYQCTFGIVQAGSYGVPQTRRRLIILAAAPTYKLPLFPEPTHVFSRRACTLKVIIDNKKFNSNILWRDSAPRRTCTIRDAMSDLPQIANGANKLEIDYGSMPESHFQRLLRGSDESLRLRDHICKNMAPLIQARIMRIPITPGSDWRDLPNIAVNFSDGTKSKVLQYRHHDKKNGRGPNGELRGVCICASGKPCNPNDKQENTLIPWCLPHTGNRHNHWAGLYGRVSWEGYFSTTVTDPEPMGKQGRILHPEQNRVVSVRECARSQGFPDHYKFSGSIQDKHRQIGNAVPPPLGAALGREIKKAILKSTPKVEMKS